MRTFRLVAGIALFLSSLAPPPAWGATVTVDTFADTYDGSCHPGDCSLRDAVAAAAPGDTVIVPSGFYALTTAEAGGSGDGSIEIGEDLALEGDGETGSFIDASALGSSPFTVVAGASLRIEGLTLFGAVTDDPAGIVTVADGTLTFDHVTASGGHAAWGGGVAVAVGTARFVDTLFLDNRSIGGAGAAWTGPLGTIAAHRSAFVGNVGRRGGALGGRIEVLRNVTIIGNLGRARGGGLRPTSEGTWEHVTIARNRAPVGGAVDVAGGGGPIVTDHAIVAGNRSGRGGQCHGRLESAGHNLESGTGCGFGHTRDQRRTDPLLGPVRSNGGPTPTAAIREGSPADGVGGSCPGRDQRGAPRQGRCDAGAYERVLCRGRAVDIVGTPGDDEFSGGLDPDTFLGLDGDDEFQGSLGDDRACGGSGADHLIGGPGEDVMAGGDGPDTLDGEEGVDRCIGGRGRDELIGCET